MRLFTRLFLFLALLTGLTACDSGGDEGVDPGAVAGSYSIETLRFTSSDEFYNVNVTDTLRASRVFVESDSRDFDMEYQLRGTSGRTAISGSYSLSGTRITLQAGKKNEPAFQRILLPPELRLRYDADNPNRLVGERENYEVNLQEYNSKYSATGSIGTLHVVLERL